jgi:hypothetical protein
MAEGLADSGSPVRAMASSAPSSLEIREGRIHDLDTALRRLDEERRK